MKSGLEFFPLDVYLDDKFELMEAQFGLDGFAVVIKLFQKIYAAGYYCDWSDEVALLFGKRAGIPGDRLEAILHAALLRGIFDRRLFDRYHILTSEGIQRRYFEAVCRRKRVEVWAEYLLCTDLSGYRNVYVCRKNGDISPANADKPPQRRGEETESTAQQSTEEKPGGSAAHGGAAGAGGGSLSARVWEDYRRLCPSLAQESPSGIPEELTPAREQAIRDAEPLLQDRGGFSALFERAEASDFLTGRSGGWRAGFDWILRPANISKILAGNYDNWSRGGRKSSRIPADSSLRLDEYEEQLRDFVPVYREEDGG